MVFPEASLSHSFGCPDDFPTMKQDILRDMGDKNLPKNQILRRKIILSQLQKVFVLFHNMLSEIDSKKVM